MILLLEDTQSRGGCKKKSLRPCSINIKKPEPPHLRQSNDRESAASSSKAPAVKIQGLFTTTRYDHHTMENGDQHPFCRFFGVSPLPLQSTPLPMDSTKTPTIQTPKFFSKYGTGIKKSKSLDNISGPRVLLCSRDGDDGVDAGGGRRGRQHRCWGRQQFSRTPRTYTRHNSPIRSLTLDRFHPTWHHYPWIFEKSIQTPENFSKYGTGIKNPRTLCIYLNCIPNGFLRPGHHEDAKPGYFFGFEHRRVSST